MRKQTITFRVAGRDAVIVTVEHNPTPHVKLTSNVPDNEAKFVLAIGMGLIADKMLGVEREMTIILDDPTPIVTAIQDEKLRLAGN